MHRRFQLILLPIIIILALSIASCGRTQTFVEPPVTPPAISVQITKGDCPSVEVLVGMQIAWTNRDNADHVLIIERVDDHGVIVDAGGTDLLKPGDYFLVSLTEPGQYLYYCSKDRTAFGTITVLPGSYPYP